MDTFFTVYTWQSGGCNGTQLLSTTRGSCIPASRGYGRCKCFWIQRQYIKLKQLDFMEAALCSCCSPAALKRTWGGGGGSGLSDVTPAPLMEISPAGLKTLQTWSELQTRTSLTLKHLPMSISTFQTLLWCDVIVFTCHGVHEKGKKKDILEIY